MNDISFNFFNAQDVVRHPVVARIVQAYEDYDAKVEKEAKIKKEHYLREQAAKDAVNKNDDSTS